MCVCVCVLPIDTHNRIYIYIWVYTHILKILTNYIFKHISVKLCLHIKISVTLIQKGIKM